MNRLVTLLSLICLTTSLSFAQPAPDFTVTNSHGETVSLYADYLNQGKVVVIEIMFISCPPCNQIAPLMEPLYQSWGGGNGDVEFISITTLSGDLNHEMETWEMGHGLTYAGVGHDGGAQAARAPYTNGTYGQFFGTPTFVVISPQGQVQYDVSGSGDAATIDSISAAIDRALNGGGDVISEYTVSGQVTDTKDRPVPGVAFKLYDASADQLIDLMVSSDVNGMYSITLDPAQVGDGDEIRLERDAPDVDEVTAFDMALIQRHILEFEELPNAFEVLKADLNNDETINILDVVEIRKLILGINNSWPFIDAVNMASESPVMPPNGPLVEYANFIPLDTGVGVYEVNFKALKMGDVSNSYIFD